MSMATKLGRVVTYNDVLPSIKSHDPLMTWSCDITSQTKSIRSPLPQRHQKTTNFGRKETYREGFPLIKLHDRLLSWS